MPTYLYKSAKIQKALDEVAEDEVRIPSQSNNHGFKNFNGLYQAIIVLDYKTMLTILLMVFEG